jgi:hypothetical protein
LETHPLSAEEIDELQQLLDDYRQDDEPGRSSARKV